MFELIPDDLKKLPNWVCWKSIPDENSHSGIRKIPINPITGGQAMSNNPDTWTDFRTAVAASDSFDGIGFMFSNSGYFGVDLDDCRHEINEYLLGQHDNIVSEFITALDSYTEQSQSGNGIHIICKGKLPEGARRKGKIEMYDSGRFFIMTGKAIGGAYEITDGTEKIIPLHEKYLGKTKCQNFTISPAVPTPVTAGAGEIIQRIKKSRQGELFSKLYGGDITGYPSQSEADIAFCNILAFWCGGNTDLMDEIYRRSGLMRSKWDRKQSGSTYGAITLNRAVADCQNFYNENRNGLNGYSLNIKSSDNKPVEVYSDDMPSSSKQQRIYSLDDTGNAQRMDEKYHDVLRYNYTDKRWMYYQGGKWRYDERGMVYVAADGVLDALKKESAVWTTYEEGKFLRNFQKHEKRSRSNAAKRAMVREFEHIVAISPAQLDTNKTLVNSQSGILDLATGRITPHDPELYMTKMLGTAMPSKPKTPVLWLRFLSDIFNEDKDLIRYVQKALGYSLSGQTSEQCVFFLYGTGRNGKSTFLEIVRTILGEYASNIQPESLMMRSANTTANTDIARLKGARLVTSVEPNEGMRLNEGLLKQLTGDDVVTARKLYGDEFEFRPEFKLWMATNHKPTIRGTDIGIWRRIHIIPFTVTIPEDKIDKNLSAKLQEELPDILAWMMDGYRLWRFEGLNKPGVVQEAVKEYRNEMDVIAAFLDDECVEGGEVKASMLYAAYCEWAQRSNEYKMSLRKFGVEMTKRFKKRKSNSSLYYMNISLNSMNIKE